MKNSIIIAILLLVTIADAQSNFRYGLKTGLTYSSIRITDKKVTSFLDPEKYTDGYSINPTVGVFMSYKLSDNFILETNLSYILKGCRNTIDVLYTTIDNPDGDGTKSKITYELSAHYLALGLILKPTFSIGELNGYVVAGSLVNYSVVAPNLIERNVTDLIISYRLGAGVDIQSAFATPVFVELTYNGDFSEFYSYDYGNYWNSVVMLEVGFYL